MAPIRGTGLGLGLALVLVTTTLLFHGVAAQSGCLTALMGLTPCLSYVNGSSFTPASTCCSQLSSVVNNQPQCLCLLLNSTASSYGYNINQTQALALPGVCNVQAPSISQCNAVSPSSSPTPTSSPADFSNGTPADSTPATTTTTSTVPSGSKTVPTTGGSTSDGSIRVVSFYSAAIIVLCASYISSIYYNF